MPTKLKIIFLAVNCIYLPLAQLFLALHHHGMVYADLGAWGLGK